jgi:hypothetical protein
MQAIAIALPAPPKTLNQVIAIATRKDFLLK